jgi:hypothetical protein
MRLSVILLASSLIALPALCQPPAHFSSLERLENFRMYVQSSKCVLLISVNKEWIEKRQLPEKNRFYREGTVIFSYKKPWLGKTTFRYYSLWEDSPGEIRKVNGRREFLFISSDNADNDLPFDVGEIWGYQPDLGQVLYEELSRNQAKKGNVKGPEKTQ